MNILYVSDAPTLSGAEIVLLQHLEHFAPPAHRSSVFLRDTNTRLIDALAQRSIACTASADFSRRVVQTSVNPADLLHFTHAFARVTRQLAGVIRREGIDLVHSVSYPASLYAAFACRRTGVPQIWHDHNIKRVHAFNRPIYRFVASTSAWIIGPSDAVTRNLAEGGLPADRIRTVYNGIDLSRFDPHAGSRGRVRESLGLAEHTPAVALFGQMLPHKGHRTLIEALPAIRRAVPSVRAFLVGSLENPPYEAELRHEIAAAGLGDTVQFTGWRRDVHDVMGAMDAVVVATTTPEPAALALMETMAVARPIVATRTGGTPEIVVDGDTGLLYPPGDATALGGHLIALLSDPARRARMGTAGRARMEARFSRERHLAEVEGLYASAMGRDSRR
jgi:glycosyltransferase involved in cell wall biosynthesis